MISILKVILVGRSRVDKQPFRSLLWDTRCEKNGLDQGDGKGSGDTDVEVFEIVDNIKKCDDQI